MGVYRGDLNTFAIIGLASKPLQHRSLRLHLWQRRRQVVWARIKGLVWGSDLEQSKSGSGGVEDGRLEPDLESGPKLKLIS
ncbi:hypothetical protein RJT34_08978 [Clitoria ternatea]|uniref:Uncharacterized protein n=1 Tax=Clitoria ternatea TaxID=43366 RepID=A0AAN9K6H2_CLITE